MEKMQEDMIKQKMMAKVLEEKLIKQQEVDALKKEKKLRQLEKNLDPFSHHNASLKEESYEALMAYA